MTSWEEIGKALDAQTGAQADYAQRQLEEQQRGRQRRAEAQKAVRQFLEIMRGARGTRGAVSFDALTGSSREPRLQGMFRGKMVWHDSDKYVFVATSGMWCVREWGEHQYPITASPDIDVMSEQNLVSLKMFLGTTLRANGLPLPRD